MSETTIIPDESVGDITISRDGDGYVDLSQVARLDDDVVDTVVIPVSHAPAVALALLGGLTDELVERCSRAGWDATKDGDWSAPDWPTYWEAYQDIARAVLRAAFGVAEG